MLSGFGADDTPYHIADLAGSPLVSTRAEGQHIRSFQLALARLQDNPRSARAAIHSPGPLIDFRDEWPQFERVYTAGMQEVGRLLDQVVTQPE